MDMMHKVTNWIDHNRYKFLAIIVTVALLAVAVGCESMTPSVKDPTVQVTRQQLAAETIQIQSGLTKRKAELDAAIAIYNADVQASDKLIAAAVEELDRQDQIKAELLNLAGAVITGWAGGTGPPTAAIVGTGLTAFGMLFGIGSAADGRRKDKVIEKVKNGKQPTTSTAAPTDRQAA